MLRTECGGDGEKAGIVMVDRVCSSECFPLASYHGQVPCCRCCRVVVAAVVVAAVAAAVAAFPCSLPARVPLLLPRRDGGCATRPALARASNSCRLAVRGADGSVVDGDESWEQHAPVLATLSPLLHAWDVGRL